MTPQQLARVLRAGQEQANDLGDQRLGSVLGTMAAECDEIAEETA